MNISSISNTQPNFKSRMYFKNAIEINRKKGGQIVRNEIENLMIESTKIESINATNAPTGNDLYSKMTALANDINESTSSIITTVGGKTYEVFANWLDLSELKIVADEPRDCYNKFAVYFITKDGDGAYYKTQSGISPEDKEVGQIIKSTGKSKQTFLPQTEAI